MNNDWLHAHKSSKWLIRNNKSNLPGLNWVGSSQVSKQTHWHSAGGAETPEYQKLQENFGTVIRHLGAARVAEELADNLFAKKLITSGTLEKACSPTQTDTEKMRTIIVAVLAQVEIEPANYHKFIQILSAISGAEDVVKLLRLWFYFLVGFYFL